MPKGTTKPFHYDGFIRRLHTVTATYDCDPADEWGHAEDCRCDHPVGDWQRSIEPLAGFDLRFQDIDGNDIAIHLAPDEIDDVQRLITKWKELRLVGRIRIDQLHTHVPL